MIHSIPITLAVIALTGLFCQWLAWWVKLPAIFFLLIAGILLGPGFDLVDPDALFGDLLFPLVSLSVAIILFEGSLTLKFDQIKGLASVVRKLVTAGALLTWLVMAVSAHYLLGIDWALALLFGSVVTVTGPTVIVPMLRTVRPNSRIANVLRWEGIVIDPLGALLAVLVYEFFVSSQSEAVQHTLVSFANILFVGTALGLGTGQVLGSILRRHLLPEYLHNLATVSLLFGAFTLANFLHEEAGLLAVTVMGIYLANMRGVHIESILSFKENLTIMLISGLFIILAARINPADLVTLGWPALIILLIVQFVARPLAVFASAWGSDLSWREKTLIAWIGPRGIVAAAVSALFALRLEHAGYEQAGLIVPLTFIVILGTVFLQSATARPLARLLNVAEPSPRGFLIIGANSVARAVAGALKQAGFQTLLTDTYWENIRAARMEGLNTFYGNPISEYADQHLDLVGVGRMLGLSPQREMNVLASLRYRPEFGRQHVYTLQTGSDVQATEKHSIASEHKGKVLFSSGMSFSKFSSLLSQGAKIKTTQLTENFSFNDRQASLEGRTTPLFALDRRGIIHVFAADEAVKPEAGWTLISLDYGTEKQADKNEEAKKDGLNKKKGTSE